jgi:hypothetical protein
LAALVGQPVSICPLGELSNKKRPTDNLCGVLTFPCSEGPGGFYPAQITITLFFEGNKVIVGKGEVRIVTVALVLHNLCHPFRNWAYCITFFF